MAVPSLIENEAMIRAETEKYNVALEHGKEYAEAVGVIISLFALVEGYPPLVLEKLGVLSKADARSILGVFRAFSNRIDLLKEVGDNRPSGSIERICFGYYKGLFKEANAIRNKYAHATYSYDLKDMYLQVFSGDHNRKSMTLRQSIEDYRNDINRLKRIICELHAFCYRNEVPAGLQKSLPHPSH